MYVYNQCINAVPQTDPFWKVCGHAKPLLLFSQGEKQRNLIHLKCSPNMTVSSVCACTEQDLLLCAEH